MFDWIGENLEKMWRSLSFGMLKWILDVISNFINSIILPISKMTFINNEYVNTVYTAFSKAGSLLLVPVTMFALIAATAKGDINKQLKTTLIGVMTAILIITGAKPFTIYLSDLSVKTSTSLVNDGDVTKLDDSLLEVYLSASNTHMDSEKIANFVEDFKKPDFNYNAKTGKEFTYTLNILPSMIIGFILLFLLIYVALQMLFRTISIAFVLILMPFASLPKVMGINTSFDYAMKQIATNLVMNTLQLFTLVFAMKFIDAQTTYNPFLKVLIVIVAFLFILQAPGIVSGIVGGQQGSLLHSAQSALLGANAGRALIAGGAGTMAAIGSGIGQGLKGMAKGNGKGMAGFAGAMATAPLRGASGFIRGENKTIRGKEGSKANERGAMARQRLSNFMAKRSLQPSDAKSSEELWDSLNTGNRHNDTSTNEAPPLRGSDGSSLNTNNPSPTQDGPSLRSGNTGGLHDTTPTPPTSSNENTLRTSSSKPIGSTGSLKSTETSNNSQAQNSRPNTRVSSSKVGSKPLRPTKNTHKKK